MDKITVSYAIVFLTTAFFVSMLLTRLCIVVGPRLGLMDEPDERRVHTTPVPRAGGLAIWLAFLGVLWTVDAIFPDLFVGHHDTKNIAWTISSAILILVGFIDDRTGLKPLVKLAGQAIAAAVFCFIYYPEGFSIAGIELPFAAALVIFVVWCVALINAFNLIDGLDGLCGGLVIVSLSMIAVVALSNGNWRDSAFIMLMIGTVAGFLIYNFNPARIFLGDAGSMMLGFFIASSANDIAGERALIGSLLLPFAIAGVPLLDVILAVWRRTSRKQMQKAQGEEKKGGVFSADKDHLHHRLLEMGLSQRKVALILQLVAVFVACLCLLPMILGGRAMVATLFGLVIIGLFGIRHFARIELSEAGNLMHVKIKSRTLGISNRGLHFFYDVLALLGACFFAMVVETNFGRRPGTETNQVWSIEYIFIFVVIGMILLQIGNVYRRTWSRPTSSDFFVVGMILSMSGLLTSLIWSINKEDVTWSDYRAGLLAGQFALWSVLFPRAMPVMLRELTVSLDRRRAVDHHDARKRVLLYGAGANGSNLVNFIKGGSSKEIADFHIVGFLDEHESLRGRLFRSFKVYGGLSQINTLKEIGKLDGIVVTVTSLPSERWEELLDVTKKNGLNLYRWQCDKEFSPVNTCPDESES